MFLKRTAAETDHLSRASWAPTIILVLGLGSLALLAATDWIRERLVTVNMVRLDALVELELSIATVHLWLEEYVTGDEVDLHEISDGLSRASYLCRTLINGGTVDGFEVELPSIDEGEARVAAVEMRGYLERFAQLTTVRLAGFQANKAVGIGSELDAQYDHSYRLFLDGAKNVERATRTNLAASNALARKLYRMILISWMCIILLAVIGLWKHEKRRQKAEEALRRKELQLAQSQKMDAVGRFAGSITHDINNYLAAISTNCELVRMGVEAESPVAQKMKSALTVVAKISSLTERLLAFSRHQPAHNVSVDLNALIREFSSTFDRLIGADVQLSSHLHEKLWATRIDPGQVEQILANLVVNASQAMPSGGKIVIETDNVELDAAYVAGHEGVIPGDYVALIFSDNGPGIPLHIQEKVFEPFFTTKDQSKNSGLGLSTIYGIVQQNRGYLWLYSEPEHGTMFKIYLPRDTAGKKPEADPIPRKLRARRGKESVLLVEDSDDFRRSACALLQQLGYTVFAETNGKSALESYSAHRSELDLVITDVVMPNMSGREFVDAMRAQGGEIPVIYMSGYTADVMLERGVLDGHFNLLQKPFSADEMSRKIDEVLTVRPS